MKDMNNKRKIMLAMFGLLLVLSGCEGAESEYVDVSVQHTGEKLAAGGSTQSTVTEEEYQELTGRDGVIRASYYGEALEISYYYQEGEDYIYNMTISEDGLQDRITVLNDNQKMKSADLLAEKDLKAGRFPEHTFEIIMYSADESLIGQECLVYFKKETSQRDEDIVGFMMTISGIQTMEENQIFFSEDLCRQMGQTVFSGGGTVHYIQTEGDYGIYSGEVFVGEINGAIDLEDVFFDDSLEKDEIVLSDLFLGEYGPVMDMMLFRYYDEGGMKIQNLKVKKELFQGGAYMTMVSRELFGSDAGNKDSYSVVLRVEKDKAEQLCDELTEEGYEGVVWD